MSKNITRIEKWLSKIGWSIKKLTNVPCWIIVDHNGEETRWEVWSETDTRIEYNGKDFKGDCCFFLRGVSFRAIKGGKGNIECISLSSKDEKSNPAIFLQFYNHDNQL